MAFGLGAFLRWCTRMLGGRAAVAANDSIDACRLRWSVYVALKNTNTMATTKRIDRSARLLSTGTPRLDAVLLLLLLVGAVGDAGSVAGGGVILSEIYNEIRTEKRYVDARSLCVALAIYESLP